MEIRDKIINELYLKGVTKRDATKILKEFEKDYQYDVIHEHLNSIYSDKIKSETDNLICNFLYSRLIKTHNVDYNYNISKYFEIENDEDYHNYLIFIKRKILLSMLDIKPTLAYDKDCLIIYLKNIKKTILDLVKSSSCLDVDIMIYVRDLNRKMNTSIYRIKINEDKIFTDRWRKDTADVKIYSRCTWCGTKFKGDASLCSNCKNNDVKYHNKPKN